MKLSVIIFATLLSLSSAQTSPSASASLSSPSGTSSLSPSGASSSIAQSAAPSSSPSSSPSGGGSGGAIISVTAPLQGASYKAGDKAIISWINPSVEAISQIVLAKGGSNSLQPVSTIATNVPAASGSYTWNIPADIPAGSDYAFEFGTSPNLAFTGQFSITGGSGSSTAGAGTNSSVPASGSGASLASPASGSSAMPSSGSAGSAPGATKASPSSSAANSLTAGSVAVIGAAVISVAQLF